MCYYASHSSPLCVTYLKPKPAISLLSPRAGSVHLHPSSFRGRELRLGGGCTTTLKNTFCDLDTHDAICIKKIWTHETGHRKLTYDT
ncbi:hypothetical protein AB205_0186230 [Aquarana catesbeiana]|uniref:Uncharacterized protein n=1 Tax=Aquarana catesbeiana TaxID=8400 RepID=A0A2G9SK58_AQUCT|nr:hypothetical protein AB205_0186230 [Aquarana catesbeiana]